MKREYKPAIFWNGVAIVILALVIWSPLLTFLEDRFGQLAAILYSIYMGFGILYVADDFANFQTRAKPVHYILGAVLSPLWPLVRPWFIKGRNSVN